MSWTGASTVLRMKSFSFRVIASGDVDSSDIQDRLFDAGCDDAAVSVSEGKLILAFDREAEGFDQAVSSAIRDIAEAGAKAEQIEADGRQINVVDLASSHPAAVPFIR